VIDPRSGVLYVVSKTGEGGGYAQRLHALDITTGAEMPDSPALVSASVAGTGAGSSGGVVSFEALKHNQRSGLMLLNGVVYVAWASHGDNDPYHGWLLGYDAHTLNLVSTFNDSPNGQRAGIWQSGGAPAADSAGNIYLMTGNGTFDADSGGLDYGDSFLKLSTAAGLSVSDYFAPYDQSSLNQSDKDLGSGSPIVLPDQPSPYQHLVVGGGKEGVLYVLSRDDMGGFNSIDNGQIVESVPSDGHGIFCSLTMWQGYLYVVSASDFVREFQLSGGLISTTPVAESTVSFKAHGAIPSISANGGRNGILWAIDSSAFGYPRGSPGPAVLHAFDATDVSRELYNSQQNATRDQAAYAVKFTVPTVAGGKVYVGTQSELDVYGLLSQ
jgi:hypothetical protein